MRLRLISAAVGIPLLVAAIWLGNPWFGVLLTAVALAAGLEFLNLAPRAEARPLRLLGLLFILLFTLNGFAFTGADYAVPLLSGAVVLSLLLLLARGNTEGAALGWAWTLAGILYVGWTLGHAARLEVRPDGPRWLLFVLFATFAVDTVAFAVGRAIGRRRLAPSISPGKTQEGAIAGLLAGLVAAPVLGALLGLPLSLVESAALGVAISIAAQLGDLAESLLKRSARVKDAGGLIPGHGGVLDRYDSIVIPLLLVYYYVILSKG